MTTSFDHLIAEAGALNEQGKAGEAQSQQSLDDALKAHQEATRAEADCIGQEEKLTGILGDLQTHLAEASQAEKVTRLEVVKDYLSGNVPPDDCARQHAEASQRKNLLLETLQFVAEVERPAALVTRLKATHDRIYARAVAVRAEAVNHMLRCLIAARPLLAVNGGQLELSGNDGLTGQLVQAVHHAFADADNAKTALDAEVAKQAANSKKLQ